MDSSPDQCASLLTNNLEVPTKERWSTLRADNLYERRNFSALMHNLTFLCSMILNILLLSLGTYLYRRGGPDNPIFPQAIYSPVQDVLSYHLETFTSSFVQDGFLGPPTLEVDDQWKALYRVGNSRLTKSEASQLPNKTIAALAGKEEDYLVVISVFHDLHCLDRLRQTLWYFHDEHWNQTHNPFTVARPATFERDGLNGIVHLDHCINILRQSTQCFSDVSTYVFQWSEEHGQVRAHANVVHTCRDFDAVREWALDRTYTGAWDGVDPRDEQGACGSGDDSACLGTTSLSLA